MRHHDVMRWSVLAPALEAISHYAEDHQGALTVIALDAGTRLGLARGVLTDAQAEVILAAITSREDTEHPSSAAGFEEGSYAWSALTRGLLGGIWPIEIHYFYEGPPVQGCEPPPALQLVELAIQAEEETACLGPDMDCGRPLPCPDHPADTNAAGWPAARTTVPIPSSRRKWFSPRFQG